MTTELIIVVVFIAFLIIGIVIFCILFYLDINRVNKRLENIINDNFSIFC